MKSGIGSRALTFFAKASSAFSRANVIFHSSSQSPCAPCTAHEIVASDARVDKSVFAEGSGDPVNVADEPADDRHDDRDDADG